MSAGLPTSTTTNSGATGNGNATRTSMATNHLLSRSDTLPCTVAAHAFVTLVQPVARFQVALDTILPSLMATADARIQVQQRILASYILHSLYSQHPIVLNPFKHALVDVFISEKERAKQEVVKGGTSENEQLVWVIWKILRGDGNDLGPYSPNTLAKSSLPPELRPSQLFLDEGISDDIGLKGVDGSGRPMTSSIQSKSPLKKEATMPQSLIKLGVVPPVVTVNDGIELLSAARTRVLNLVEQRVFLNVAPKMDIPSHIELSELRAMVPLNPTVVHQILVWYLKDPELPIERRHENVMKVVDTVQHFPPFLASLDVIGRLLRDGANVKDFDPARPEMTIVDLVKTDILAGFFHNAIAWIERAEADTRDGLISDDRAAKAVHHICRFFNSLARLKIVTPGYDIDATEMTHFALSHSKYEEASTLYRCLVMGRY